MRRKPKHARKPRSIAAKKSINRRPSSSVLDSRRSCAAPIKVEVIALFCGKGICVKICVPFLGYGKLPPSPIKIHRRQQKWLEIPNS